MKLYFYNFDKRKNKLQKGCAEVEEKPKTYKPIERFPRFFDGSYVRKDGIGKISGYWEDTIFLAEENDDLAKSIFIEKALEILYAAKKEVEASETVLQIITDSEFES